MTERTLLRTLRQAVQAAGSQKALAAQYGVSPALVSRVLDGYYPPPKKLLAAMGYRRITRYEKVA